MVLSDALVVQSQGLRVSRSKGCFGISKIVLGSQKMVVVDIVDNFGIVDNFDIVDNFGIIDNFSKNG